LTEVLDSFALLVFMNKETAARTVQEAFARADQGKVTLIRSAINAAEVYYILAKRKSKADADIWKDEIMPSLSIQIHVPTLDNIMSGPTRRPNIPFPMRMHLRRLSHFNTKAV
jgi:PIN domain nuclease of toxin-antitoxin system